MAYQRNDKNCDPVDPQPGSSTVNQFSGNEGWATVTYKTVSYTHLTLPTTTPV